MNVVKVLLNNSDLLKLWLVQIFSQAGTKIYQIAILWWIVNVYKASSLEVAIYLIMCAVPAILFVKKIGQIVDTMNVKQLMVFSDFAAMFLCSIVAILFYTENFNFYAAIFIGFALSTVQGIFDPSLQKAIPEIMDKDLDEAISLISSTQSFATFLGAMFGSGLLVVLNYFQVAILNGLSFLVSALVLFTLHFKFHRKKEDALSLPFVMSKGIKNILFSFTLVNFFLTPVLLVLPIFVDRILKLNVGHLSFLEAMLSFGTILGTLMAPSFKVNNKVKFASYIFFFLSPLLLVPGFIPIFSIYSFACLLLGVFLGLMNTVFITYFHEIIPHENKGEFFAKLMALISLAFPLSFLFFGFLLDLVSLQVVCTIQGLGVFVVAINVYVFGSKIKLDNTKVKACEA